MKKYVSLFLAVLMLMSLLAVPAFAEDAAEQVEVVATVKNIIEVDGLQFKDLNDNGELDVYEDWRADVEDRITDLISQMTLEEKLSLMIHCNTAGQYTGTYPATEQYLYEQDCPFEVPDLGMWNTASGYSCWWYINVYGITHFLDNTNGTAEEQIEVHNAIQGMCEETRLGIPMTFSCDREYNGWGGWTDDPHDAFGTANDPELASELWDAYMKEMKAVGYQMLLHPYSVELGAFNGEDPEYVAEMTALEISAMVENDLVACAKHWIVRGGDSSFANARSVAQTVENWMVPWKAAIEAGTQYIMCSTVSGLSNSGSVVFDEASMSYLRDTLGFDGVVLTDWTQIGAWGNSCSGIAADGTDLSTLSLKELYAKMFSNGVDQVGNVSVMPGQDASVYFMSSAYPEAMKAAVDEGLLEESVVDAAARRILRAKFEIGLFENPYSDAEAAMALCASDEYLAEAWEITTPDELAAARNQDVVALERELQASSTILVKNDDSLLPLAEGTKVYFTSTNELNNANYAAALASYATVVETMEEADVVVADLLTIDDASTLIVDDAKALGKKVVLTLNCIDPTSWAVESADALLFITYKVTPDHGAGIDGFSFRMEGSVYADLLFGAAEPTGMIVKEIARDKYIDGAQWKDLAGDQGASDYVRLLLLGIMEDNPDVAVPNNYGDPLLCYEYGMRYNETGSFEYKALITPTTVVEAAGSYGRTVITSVPAPVQSGEAFTVSCLLKNTGTADVTTVEVYDGDTLIAEKIMAINTDSWRVVEIEITLEGAGEHTITVGDLTATITVE